MPGAPNQERILCEQEAKFCEACANNPEGIVQDGEAGTLSCFLSCQGLSKGYPMCETYDASDFPLALSDIKGNQGLESKRILRGGNVGIIAESQMCRFKSDYRQFRAPESGTQDNLNNATGNGVGFRCARDLSDNEVTFFEAQGFSFAEVTSQPASSSQDIDAGGSADTSGSSTDAGSETTEDTSTDASALDDTSSIDDTETSAGDDAGPTPTDADTGDETEAGGADTSEDATSGDTEDDKDDAEDKSDSSNEEPTS